jgi:hypothetical protein
VSANHQEGWQVVRIICALFVAAALILSVSAPAAAARSCHVEWGGQGSFVACSTGEAGASGIPWTWAFVAGWSSLVALLLLTERCARRRELNEHPGGVSPFASSSHQAF